MSDGKRANCQPRLHAHARRARKKEAEKGMPTIVVMDNKTKKVMMSNMVPSKGAQECALEVVRKFAEQIGYSKVIAKSGSEPAILVLKSGGRRAWELPCRRPRLESTTQTERRRML